MRSAFVYIAGPRYGENHGTSVVEKIPAIFLCCTVI